MQPQPILRDRLARALFNPSSIALVGASGDPRKNTSRPQRFLRKHGYTGRIVPVNPGRQEIFGEIAYPDIAAVPGAVDHAFIMVPAAAVAAAVEQCAEKGIPVATIYSDGFAETGPEGRRAQERLLAIASASGMRLVGPNCIGLISTEPSCALSVNAVLEFADITKGPLAIVSQSGSMIGGLLSRGLGRGVGFSKLISVGNEADLGVGEIADLLVDDPHTGAILLFMETLREGTHLARAARRAYAAGKPIIAYKMGRSEVGQDLAASHTGAMAAGDEVADAFFRAHGILRVDVLEALFELPALVHKQQPAGGHRVAVMTTTGGGAASVVDRLGTCNVEVVAPTERVISNLAQQDVRIGTARLTDLTLAGARKEIYSAVLNELLASDHCDLVLAVVGSSAQYQPDIAIEPIVTARTGGKPLAVFLAPHAEQSLKLLADAGIAGFRTPEACADAIRAWRDWRAPADAPSLDPVIRQAVQTVLSGMSKSNEYDACRAFAALGIPQVASQIIAAPGEPVRVAFPLAAKILSGDIAHKTEAGGVALNIADAETLRARATGMLAHVASRYPHARIDGILLQHMEHGLAEVIVGYRRDPQGGPMVVLGIGGVLAEIYRDFALRLAPVSVEEAQRMIEEVKGLAVIRGYRNLPRGDLTALARAVSAFSQLAAIDDIQEAEINPLIVKGEGAGVVAVDGLIIKRAAEAHGGGS